MTTENPQRDDTNKTPGLYAHWWHRLVNSGRCRTEQWRPLPTAHKAILRRCKNLDEVMLSEPFQALWQSVPEDKRSPAKMEVAALVAWTLSAVKRDSENSLAKAMAQRAGPDSDRPKVSPLRFQRLIKARDTAEFALRLRRILLQIDGMVSVQDLAEEIERWFWQNRSPDSEANPSQRQVLRWAMAYYAAAPKAQ